MTDLPGLSFDHGDDIAALRDAVREFAAVEIAPRAAEIDRTDQFPMDLWRKMGDIGLLGVTVEESLAVVAWVIWPISSQWKKFHEHRPRSASRMVRIPIYA